MKTTVIIAMNRKASGLVLSQPMMIALLLIMASSQVLANKCLFISSYHKGYAWSDGVENGLRETLADQCEFKQFDMDTKRQKSESYKHQIALKAKELIESWKPDVVIAADDNAAKYLIQPYFRDHEIPFVFCGINWSVSEYGFPYKNTTGMVEVAPIHPLFENVEQILTSYQQGFYIGADTLTERKNLARFKVAAKKRKIKLDHGLAKDTNNWIKLYKNAQFYDFVILGSKSGITDWDHEKVSQQILQTTHRLSLTNHDWMMPYTILGLTKVPEEQGQWAGQAVLHIIGGAKASDIPIISNRKWDIWLNENILQRTTIEIPKSISRKAKKIYSLE